MTKLRTADLFCGAGGEMATVHDPFREDSTHGMDVSPLRVLSLCSGVGMLDVGLDLALRAAGHPGTRPVCYVERDSFAASVLVARMEDKALGEAPVWDDLATFDGRPWRGAVDCVVGGYPCQPFSLAGRRLGEDDPRHLWPHIRRILGEVRPELAFFENVPGHATLGLPDVVKDLEGLGFRVAAGLFSSANAGAAHVRQRLYILGVGDTECVLRRESGSGGERSIYGDGDGSRRQEGPSRVGGANPSLVHTEGDGRRQGRSEPSRRERTALSAGPDGLLGDTEGVGLGTRQQRVREAGQSLSHQPDGELADAHGGGRRPQGDGGQQAGQLDHTYHELADADHDGRARTRLHPRSRRPGEEAACPAGVGLGLADAEGTGLEGGRGGSGRGVAEKSMLAELRRLVYAPGPGDGDAWRDVLDADAFLAPALESALYRLSHGLAARMGVPVIRHRTDQLRCVGNGVDPHVAAEAYLVLFCRLISAIY